MQNYDLSKKENHKNDILINSQNKNPLGEYRRENMFKENKIILQFLFLQQQQLKVLSFCRNAY